MLVHVKRTRSYRIGQRARVERRCSAKITAIDVQVESGRLVLLVRWGFASLSQAPSHFEGGRRTADGGRASDHGQLAWGLGDRARDNAVADVDLADAGSLPSQRKLNFLFLGSCVY